MPPEWKLTLADLQTVSFLEHNCLRDSEASLSRGAIYEADRENRVRTNQRETVPRDSSVGAK